MAPKKKATRRAPAKKTAKRRAAKKTTQAPSLQTTNVFNYDSNLDRRTVALGHAINLHGQGANNSEVVNSAILFDHFLANGTNNSAPTAAAAPADAEPSNEA